MTGNEVYVMPKSSNWLAAWNWMYF